MEKTFMSSSVGNTQTKINGKTLKDIVNNIKKVQSEYQKLMATNSRLEEIPKSSLHVDFFLKKEDEIGYVKMAEKELYNIISEFLYNNKDICQINIDGFYTHFTSLGNDLNNLKKQLNLLNY